MSTVSTRAPLVRPARAIGVARAGALTMVPIVVAYIPFALVIGTVLADHCGVLLGVIGTLAIFGGSAHVATVRATGDAGTTVAVMTGLLVNARVLVYSAGLARRWRDQPAWFRLIAAAMVTDPTWAAGERHADTCGDPRERRIHFLAAAVTLGAGFTATVAAGMVLGARFSTAELAIAVPLCMLAMAGHGLGRPRYRRTAVVAAAVALVTTGWPSGTGLVAAIVAGCVAGGVRRGPVREVAA